MAMGNADGQGDLVDSAGTILNPLKKVTSHRRGTYFGAASPASKGGVTEHSIAERISSSAVEEQDQKYCVQSFAKGHEKQKRVGRKSFVATKVKRLMRFRAHRGAVRSLRVIKKPYSILSSGLDESVRVWSFAGREITVVTRGAAKVREWLLLKTKTKERIKAPRSPPL